MCIRDSIYASRYLEGNNETCPTGNILPVAGTPMDFRAGKTIGRDIDTGFSQTLSLIHI